MGRLKCFPMHTCGSTSQHLWEDAATEARDSIAEEMTPEQIAEAQKLARECVRKEYKDC